jgi:hypothetical protein
MEIDLLRPLSVVAGHGDYCLIASWCSVAAMGVMSLAPNSVLAHYAYIVHIYDQARNAC